MIDEIRKILKSDFEIDLFDAAILNLKDTENKLCYNNFAYSMRELSRHFLYNLAPEEKVSKCSWYKIETENKKPTRKQRIKYAIQGGISDDILDALGLDATKINDEINSLKDTITSLSKFTHIQPETFNLNEFQIMRMSNEVLTAFKTFAERIEINRNSLQTFLDGKIEEQIIEGEISNCYENVDMLAPHHSLDYHEISKYHIIEINQNSIIVEVLGVFHFTLEYGSRKERREGDGFDLHESFPFQTKIFYEIDSNFPSNIYEIEDFEVDIQGWYGDLTDKKIDKMIDDEINKNNNS